MKPLKVMWVLGTQLMSHLVTKPMEKARILPPHNLETYRNHFDGEGLFSLTPDQRDGLPDMYRCTGCGLCVLSCPMAGSSTIVLDPCRLVSSFLRDFTTFVDTADYVSQSLPCEEGCDRCGLACPERIDIRGVRELILLRSENLLSPRGASVLKEE